MKSVFFALVAAVLVEAQQSLYGQCGGIGWNGPTTCVSGATCTYVNDWYSQCLPGSSNPSPTTTSTPPTNTNAPPAGGLPFLGGVNLAGYDFSVYTNGSFSGTGIDPPNFQVNHFASQGVNAFRIPFAWQLMTPQLGGQISSSFFSRYDATVQAALGASTRPYVILDLHNYARWNGKIIAQGGPSNDQFVSVWSQLAAKYRNNPKIIFGVMNEPHDLQSVSTWVNSVQLAVNAIRAAGATSQYILIPGSSWSSAEAFPNEAGPMLMRVTDPAGGTNKLIFDVHKYLDFDNSGTHTECSTNNVAVFTTLANYLRQNGKRQALLSETGAGNTQSCVTAMKAQLAYIKANSDVLTGYTIWSAGSFNTQYELSVTPNPNGSDQLLWAQAVRPNLP
ncbi:glycoside hydrolase superfamily [Panaeolus papilionaceus]|nr:glycoside hydrolase superfamily [Panaeolus papilionaceus]